jgi:hypothetical protein
MTQRVCLLWKRWGPYHIARLRGATDCNPALDVIGVQTARIDSVYAWAPVRFPPGLQIRTLFPGQFHRALEEAWGLVVKLVVTRFVEIGTVTTTRSSRVMR